MLAELPYPDSFSSSSNSSSFSFARLAPSAQRRAGVQPRPAAGWLLTLLLVLLGGATTTALAQTNRFVTHDDTNQVPAGTAKLGNVIPNDENPDNLANAAFVVMKVDDPAHGTLNLSADGSYVYTPNAGYRGTDSFTYQVCQPGATPTCSNTSTVMLNIYNPAVVCALGTGPNLLQNPSFTDGNVGFTTNYTYVPRSSAIDLWIEGRYAVDTDAKVYSGAASFEGVGHNGPGDKFMFVNGGPSLAVVYSQIVTVLPNRYYSFSIFATSINATRPAQLALVVGGKSTSAVTTLPEQVGPYVRISDLYFSGPGPAGGFPVAIEIRDVNKAPSGNDFGIDDLYFGSCSTFLLAETKSTPLVPNVPVPAPIVPLSATIEAGGSVGVTVASFTIQSLPPTGVLTYNGVPVTLGQVIPVSGPGSLSSGGLLAYTPTAGGSCAAGSASFTYTATDSDRQGSNNIATYTIPLGPVPAPVIKPRGDNPFCEGQSVLLSGGARPGYLYTWFNGTTVVNGAGAVLNDSTFAAKTTGSYTVKVELAGCPATSAPLSVTTKACPKGEPEPCSFDEKFINTWYFGNKAGLNFNGQAPPAKTPAVLTDGQMVTPAAAATMSDNNGSLLFYSNGETVWNRSHAVMPNGTGLKGNPAVTDGPVAIRRPGSTTRYFLFTQDARGGDNGLSYSEIDMSLNGGQGDVVAATKNTFLTRRTTEKMTAVLHANGCDSWIIVHGWGDAVAGGDASGGAFLAYQLTPTGVKTTPVVSVVGPLHAPSIAAQGYRGQMKVSPDGKQLAVARFNDGPVPANGTIELYDFDAKTGAVSNPRIIDSGEGGYYGVEFSPGRTRLYATILSPPKLLQFKLNVPADSIALSKKVIPTPAGGPNLGSIQAAPDGKLYVSRDNQPELGVIPYPDSLGKAVGYLDQGQPLGGRLSGLGLPNFNQSFLVKVGFSLVSTGCLVLKFQAGSSIPDPETYAWNFGDPGSGANNTSTIADPSHTFPMPGEYTLTLRITKACLCKEIKTIIRVPGSPTPGSIAASQALCNGVAPAPLTSTALAGEGDYAYAYQWQSSADNTNWTDIAGATAPSYAPGPLAATTYFRRRVTSGFCAPAFTAPVTITVLPPLAAGTIAASQTVCGNNAPAPLTSSAAATGGTGTFAYQWESSLDNATWTAIGGATGEAFAPGPLSATTYFRRRVSSGACTTAPSNVVTLTSLPPLTAGTISADQALCAGGAAAPLTSTAAATGGTGTFAYQWESSLDNITWTAIGGATGETLPLGQFTVTTYFRRRVSAGTCAPLTSNVVVISVSPALTAGGISSSQTLCAGATPPALGSTAGAGGGTGTYAYQWESGPNDSNWTAIAGATGETFAPGPILVTTYFRRRVSSGPCGPAYTNNVVLTVLPAVAAGRIAADQDICAGATPTPLSSTGAATGGTGTYAYQWESAPDNVSWTAIGGATAETFAPGPLSATTYFRRRVVSGSGACATAYSESVAVRVQPIVTTGVSVAAPPVQCPGTPLTFTAVPINAGNAPTYRWLVNNVPVANGPTFSSSTLVTGDQVRVELTPTAGLCSTGPAAATVTVTRTVTPPPTLAIGVQPGGPVCAGAPLTFSITSVTEAGPAPDYQWQVNGNDVTGAKGPVFTSTTLRDGQTVTLRLRTTTACGQPATAVSNGVGVRISPPVKVNAGPDQEILAGSSVRLEGSADGTYPVTWTPAVGLVFLSDDRLHPLASPTVTTTYTLSAGEGGCAAADQVIVTVRPPIRIPNAFTPNGDGRDDTWQIEHIEEFPDNTVSVFNRWGNRIFSATNYSRANEWRGDINGQPAPVGTYYYVVVTKGPLGRSYSGPITILY